MFYLDPIVDRELKLLGHEFLFRGCANPEDYFKHASSSMDFRVFVQAVAFKKALDLKGLSFININPNTIKDYRELIKKTWNADIIIEITENDILTEAIEDIPLCIDDFGKKLSNLDRIILLNPSFVKVDMKLLKDLSNQGLFHLAMTLRDCGVEYLIAEKIENEEEFQRALNSGFDFFQGYFIRRLAGKD